MSIGEWVWVVRFVRYLIEPSVHCVSNEEILIVQGTQVVGRISVGRPAQVLDPDSMDPNQHLH